MRCVQFLLLSAVLAGCSGGAKEPSLVAVKGKVTYQGKPVPRATVMFLAKDAPLATGTTNEQGEFTLATKGRAGAVTGEHRVTVTAMEATSTTSSAPIEIGSPEYLKMQKAAPPKPPKSLIPAKFQNAETSGIKLTVDADASKNDLIVDLGA